MLSFVRINPNFPRLLTKRPRRLVCSLPPVQHLTPPKSLSNVTKFLLLSDLHVRRESASVCVEALRIAHAEALRRHAAILFLGDFWHARGALPVQPLNAVLKELENWSVPVVMIPGNHDLISRTGSGVSLVPLATTLGTDHCLLITSPSFCLDALFVPYMHEVSKLKAALKFAQEAPDNIRAVFCHAEVAGARLADRIISMPSSRTISPTDFPPSIRVYSGHLHRPHTVSDNITYVGSPYQVSASEQGQEKKLLVLDRGQDWAVVDSIPIDIGPRHFTLALPSDKPFPQIRTGDRVVIQTSDVDNEQIKGTVAELRERGTRVELQMLPSETQAASEISNPDPFAPAEPRISSATMSNCDLFEQYATIKNLGPDVIKKGNELLQEIGGKSSSVHTSISGKDVVISWGSVVIRGFGSFLERVEYPLRNRGLILVMGRDGEADGTITGRTNGTGKTTLVMAALWAMTGRTDARPDGSVERGVSLEMVHDDAKDCEVTVQLTLSGDRVLSQARELMTPEERIQAGLEQSSPDGDPEQLNVSITRMSSRVGSARKRSYRQTLCLKVNGVDLSAIEVKETQSRIESFVDSALLPHAVFFGQHMGAARGLLDSTDRALKENLALVFPLDMWKEARKQARDKTTELQDLLLSSEAALDAAKSICERLKAAESSARNQHDNYETERKKKIYRIISSLESLFSSFSYTGEDSIAYTESFSPSNNSKELLTTIDEWRRELQALGDEKDDNLDTTYASYGRDLALARAALETMTSRRTHIMSLARKCEEWEVGRKSRIAIVCAELASVQLELNKAESPAEIEQTWKQATQVLDECDQKLQELADISLRQGDSTRVVEFSDQILSISLAGRKLSELQEEIVRLQTSLNDIRARLIHSQELSFVRHEELIDEVIHVEDAVGTAIVACEKCLRPFDGDMYAEARSKLEQEASSIESEIQISEEKSEMHRVEYERALDLLRENIQRRRASIIEKKRLTSSKLGRLRAHRDAREAALRQRRVLTNRKEGMERESNLYELELLEYLSQSSAGISNGSVADTITHSLRVAEKSEELERDTVAAADAKYQKVAEAIEKRRSEENELQCRRAHIRAQIQELTALHSKVEELEVKQDLLQSEGNPFAESLRMLNLELSREKSSFIEKELRHDHLKHNLDIAKVLDVAFGPRGVQSFILEEGLLWLEKLSGMYLERLSGGELMLQIRAFSDYKSSNRVDGENKEVVSKRVFIRRHDGQSAVRERTLKQLSGGQRRRCSLAFALAFADLAHDRAGFRSSLLVLDEVLQSLDEDGRQRTAKMLPELLHESRYPRDSLIVVTQDEVPELSELATGGIDVVLREGDQSRVVFEQNGDQI